MAFEHKVPIPRRPDCAAYARRHLRELLEGEVSGETLDRALLLASELVTNAYLHGTGEIELRASLTDERLRVEVVDEGSPGAVPQIRAEGADSPGGWGLQLVETVASGWGVFEGTTHVWAELAMPEEGLEPPTRGL